VYGWYNRLISGGKCGGGRSSRVTGRGSQEGGGEVR
jgi:hypothetical protein